jgi:chemotaxis-related protein WspD
MREPALSDGGIAIDDCWNRIGIRGDGSCPRLTEYVHCRNCPVHEDAAAKLLDRPVDDIDLAAARGDAASRSWEQGPAAAPLGADATDGASLLVFRIGEEWLALPTTVFEQVTGMQRIHSLPHRRNAAMLGVVSIRGALLICASLVELLGLDPGTVSSGSSNSSGGAAYRRLLVVRSGEQSAVFPVDAVDGVRRFARAAYESVPATVARTARPHTRAVVRWQGRTIGLLDAALLFETLNRSLA